MIRTLCIDAIPVANSTTALYSRFGSCKVDQFAYKLLSAMRNEFGRHYERRG